MQIIINNARFYHQEFKAKILNRLLLPTTVSFNGRTGNRPLVDGPRPPLNLFIHSKQEINSCKLRVWWKTFS